MASERVGPKDFCEAYIDGRWLRLTHQRPNGVRFELWIDRDSENAQAFFQATTAGHVTTRYGAPLAQLVGADLPGFNLVGAQPIRVRSVGCSMVSQQDDDAYSLNMGAHGGIVRLKVGTYKQGQGYIPDASPFTAGVLLSPTEPAVPVFAEDGTIITRLECLPLGGVSARLEALATDLPKRLSPL